MALFRSEAAAGFCAYASGSKPRSDLISRALTRVKITRARRRKRLAAIPWGAARSGSGASACAAAPSGSAAHRSCFSIIVFGFGCPLKKGFYLNHTNSLRCLLQNTLVGSGPHDHSSSWASNAPKPLRGHGIDLNSANSRHYSFPR